MCEDSPESRYHSPHCPGEGRAPLGSSEATCSSCGRTIATTTLMLDLLGLALVARDDHRRRLDYARVDAEVTMLLTTLPLALAVERRCLEKLRLERLRDRRRSRVGRA